MLEIIKQNKDYLLMLINFLGRERFRSRRQLVPQHTPEKSGLSSGFRSPASNNVELLLILLLPPHSQ
jgi:hypothetical protein